MSEKEPTGRRWSPARIVLAVLIAAVVLVLLFTWVFPWVERNLSDPTLGSLLMPGVARPSLPGRAGSSGRRR